MYLNTYVPVAETIWRILKYEVLISSVPAVLVFFLDYYLKKMLLVIDSATGTNLNKSKNSTLLVVQSVNAAK